MALVRRDLAAHFDALTEPAVREILGNSISIRLSANSPAMRGTGFQPSLGCEAILSRYGWDPGSAKSTNGFKAGVASIKEPRAMAAELEANHRKHKSGTSFVWEYLESVKISGLVVNGAIARGKADWGDGELKPIVFEKDQTGWRVDPMPWSR